MRLSEELQEAINNCGLTLKELSDRTDIPYRTLQEWKSGNRQPPPYFEKMVIDLINKIKRGEE